MKIGIYGGTFNPIHYGHIGLALYTLLHTDLDQLWLMVTPNNPLKDGSMLSRNEQDRLAAARQAISLVTKEHKEELGNKSLLVSDFEFTLPRPSYTAQTLRALQQQMPDNEYILVIGEDNLKAFTLWREWEWIATNFRIIVYPRQETEVPVSHTTKTDNMKERECIDMTTAKRIDYLKDAPLFPISSTELRNKAEKFAYQ